MDSDLGGPKTFGSHGSGSSTLPGTHSIQTHRMNANPYLSSRCSPCLFMLFFLAKHFILYIPFTPSSIAKHFFSPCLFTLFSVTKHFFFSPCLFMPFSLCKHIFLKAYLRILSCQTLFSLHAYLRLFSPVLRIRIRDPVCSNAKKL